MINTKPTSYLKLLILSSILIGLVRCKHKESFTFQKRTIAINDFFDCQTVECAITEIFIVESIHENGVSQKINKEIENVVIASLNTEENPTVNSAEEAVQHFNTAYQNLKKEFPEEIVPYEASVNCEISFQNSNIVSVCIDSYIFTGGAHGSGRSTYLNMDVRTGEVLQNKKLFKDYDNFLSFVEQAFRKQQNIPQDQSINSTGFFFENDSFSLPENIGITDTHIILYYNDYEISSYAEGPIQLKLNKEEVTDYFVANIL